MSQTLGTTVGVCQVNDTHLHLGMSLRYQDLEMQDMLDQAKLEPHRCPHRDREDCLRDVIVSTASEELHAHCARGHLDNHLTNKLDGSEDHLGRGPAHSLWEELQMSKARDQAQLSERMALRHHGHSRKKRALEQCPPVHSAAR